MAKLWPNLIPDFAALSQLLLPVFRGMKHVKDIDLFRGNAIHGKMPVSLGFAPNEDVLQLGSCAYRLSPAVFLAQCVDVPL